MNNKIIVADALDGLRRIENESVQTCITSPPYYGLRDYGIAGQIGLEATPEEYIAKLVDVFREVLRTLAPSGTLWVNIGDSYAGSGKGQAASGTGIQDAKRGKLHGMALPTGALDGVKGKDLIGIPWLLAFALRADGWYLRQDIIWHKPNAMPEGVKDRCTKSHEYIFLLSKSKQYHFDSDAITEPAAPDNRKASFNKGAAKYDNAVVIPGQKANTSAFGGRPHERWREKDGIRTRNKRSVWTIPTQPNKEAHFATFSVDLVTPCILAGSRRGDIVLDPFSGSGTTALAAISNGRGYIGIEINPDYAAIAERRIEGATAQLDFESVERETAVVQ